MHCIDSLENHTLRAYNSPIFITFIFTEDVMLLTKLDIPVIMIAPAYTVALEDSRVIWSIFKGCGLLVSEWQKCGLE